MISTAPPAFRPPATRDGDEQFVPLATRLGAEFAPRAAAHDRDNTFVTENYADLRESGYPLLPIPAELGGFGARLPQLCLAEAELARGRGATARRNAMRP